MKTKKINCKKLASSICDVINDCDHLLDHLDEVYNSELDKAGVVVPEDDDEQSKAYKDYCEFVQALDVLTDADFKDILAQAIKHKLAKTNLVKSHQVVVV